MRERERVSELYALIPMWIVIWVGSQRWTEGEIAAVDDDDEGYIACVRMAFAFALPLSAVYFPLYPSTIVSPSGACLLSTTLTRTLTRPNSWISTIYQTYPYAVQPWTMCFPRPAKPKISGPNQPLIPPLRPLCLPIPDFSQFCAQNHHHHFYHNSTVPSAVSVDTPNRKKTCFYRFTAVAS